MTERQIFKMTILSHDVPLFEKLDKIFGVDFEKSYTKTSGAAFAYSHFDTDGGQRLTAQFWMLDSSPQWALVRNLYLKGASGIILLHDPSIKNATEINQKMLREFFSVNRFPVPIMVFNASDSGNIGGTAKFGKEIERWAGYRVPVHSINEPSEDLEEELSVFMSKVKDWRAKNVIFQTLKLYFDLDSITNHSRSVRKIIKQLRRIYTSHYYELIDDKQIYEIIQQAAIIEGFTYDSEKKAIIYEKQLAQNPWEKYEDKITKNEFDKPKVEHLD